MYFWKIDKLKDDIVNNKLTQKDEFLYVIVWFILFEVALTVSAYTGADENIYDTISTFLDITISLFGIYYAYLKNGANKGKEFLKRYLIISFVVSIRLIIITIPIFFLISVAVIATEDLTSLNIDNLEDILVLLYILIANIIYIYLCAKHIKDVADRTIISN